MKAEMPFPIATWGHRMACVSTARLAKSRQRGAVSFLPKDDLNGLPETLADLLERLEGRKSLWMKSFRFLGAVFREAWRFIEEDTNRLSKYPRIYW